MAPEAAVTEAQAEAVVEVMGVPVAVAAVTAAPHPLLVVAVVRVPLLAAVSAAHPLPLVRVDRALLLAAASVVRLPLLVAAVEAEAATREEAAALAALSHHPRAVAVMADLRATARPS